MWFVLDQGQVLLREGAEPGDSGDQALNGTGQHSQVIAAAPSPYNSHCCLFGRGAKETESSTFSSCWIPHGWTASEPLTLRANTCQAHRNRWRKAAPVCPPCASPRPGRVGLQGTLSGCRALGPTRGASWSPLPEVMGKIQIVSLLAPG